MKARILPLLLLHSQNFELTSCKISTADDTGSGEDDAISVFPNPADGTFKLSVDLSADLTLTATVDILDQIGKVVSSSQTIIESGLLDAKISASDLPSGFYWIRVVIMGKTYRAKLIVQKS